MCHLRDRRAAITPEPMKTKSQPTSTPEADSGDQRQILEKLAKDIRKLTDNVTALSSTLRDVSQQTQNNSTGLQTLTAGMMQLNQRDFGVASANARLDAGLRSLRLSIRSGSSTGAANNVQFYEERGLVTANSVSGGTIDWTRR